jgi:aspartyl-tRNA(Asn)/glutamyl-tRNA(Gln) amidotransferase subunit A
LSAREIATRRSDSEVQASGTRQWTLAEAAAAIATGSASPSEILAACLPRAETGDAFVELDAAGARAQAAALDAELVARGPRTSLHGIPVAVKDIIDVRGMGTRANSRILADNLAGNDAPVVACMRSAGANILGKVVTHEFAYGVVTPACRNPCDPGRIAGGSSGGSAVAVATGGVLGALGTDTAGSIRIPASLCGVCGLRPRRGLLAMDGIIATAPTLDVCGPMARSAEDLAVFWEVLSGRAVPQVPLASLRLGVPASLEAITQADAGVCDAVRDDDRDHAGGWSRGLRRRAPQLCRLGPLALDPADGRSARGPSRSGLVPRPRLRVHRGDARVASGGRDPRR